MTLTQTTPTLPDKASLDRILEKCKGRMFFIDKPGISWIASLVCSHKYVWDDTVPTAWCDGVSIGINPHFFLNLEWGARITLLAHEVGHPMYDHFDRMGDRDPEIWNIAGDFVINNDLDRMGFSFKGLEFACLDHQYDNMSTEQIYDLLIGDPGHCKRLIANLTANNPGGVPQLSGDIRPTSEQDKPQKISNIVNAKQAAMAADDFGSMPGEVQDVLEKLLNPVLPWYQLLERFLNERNQDDYSWKRPNRRHEDIYLPSMISDNGLEHLLYFFDVSGSVTKAQASVCLTELVSLHENLQPKQITLATFDTQIQDTYDFYVDDVITHIDINGRGGTDLTPVYEMIQEKKPTAAVVFTDLDCLPMQDPGIPVIWIVLDNPKKEPDFGVSIHLDTTQIN